MCGVVGGLGAFFSMMGIGEQGLISLTKVFSANSVRGCGACFFDLQDSHDFTSLFLLDKMENS